MNLREKSRKSAHFPWPFLRNRQSFLQIIFEVLILMIMCCTCGKRMKYVPFVKPVPYSFETVRKNKSKSPFYLQFQSGSVVISTAVSCGDNGAHSRWNRKPVGGSSGCKSVKMSPSLFNFVDAKDKFTVRSSGFTFASFTNRPLFCCRIMVWSLYVDKMLAAAGSYVSLVMFVLPRLAANASGRLS